MIQARGVVAWLREDAKDTHRRTLVNIYYPSTPTEGGSLFLQSAFSEQNHLKNSLG
jgi:hypothetical protein